MWVCIFQLNSHIQRNWKWNTFCQIGGPPIIIKHTVLFNNTHVLMYLYLLQILSIVHPNCWFLLIRVHFNPLRSIFFACFLIPRFNKSIKLPLFQIDMWRFIYFIFFQQRCGYMSVDLSGSSECIKIQKKKVIHIHILNLQYMTYKR